MSTKTLHINNPSKGLLSLVRKLEADKEAKKKQLLDKKDAYFPEKK